MSRWPFRTLALGLLLGTVNGCGDDPLSPEVEALAGARARWEATGYTDYTYLYSTIDGLFDRLAESLAADPVVFEVTYDGAAGYPRSAQIDISEQIADEEYSFTASDLAAAAP